MGIERRSFEINGVTYDSIDAVPEPQRSELRRLLADADGDGVPDVFQSGTEHVTMNVVHEHTRIDVDGVTYDSIDDVPEPQRSMVQRALESSQPNRAPTSPRPAARPVSPDPPQPGASPIVSSAGSSRTRLLAAFIAIDAIAVGVIAWLLLR